MTSKPVRVAVDPQGKVLFSLNMNPGEDLLKKSLQAGNPSEKIWAAKELINIGTRNSFQIIEEIVNSEKFWGMRASIAELLSENSTSFAAALLAKMWSNEIHPRAAMLMAHATIKIKDPEIEIVARKFVENSATSGFQNLAYALQTLGTQRNSEIDFWRIEKFLHDETWLGIIRSSALLAFANLRNAAGFDLLSKRILLGNEIEESRTTAIKALGRLAGWLDNNKKREAVDLIGEVLKQNIEVGNGKIKLAVIKALADLQASHWVEACRQAKAQIPDQEWPAVDEKLKKMGGKSNLEVNKLKEEIEKLNNCGKNAGKNSGP